MMTGRTGIALVVGLAFGALSCATAPPVPRKPAETTNTPWQRSLTPDVKIWADRPLEGPNSQTLVVYGSGVAVLDGREQFQMPREQVEQMLTDFAKFDFGTIPARGPRGKQLRGRAGIATDSYWREAAQLWESPVDARLAKLIDALFERALPFAAKGGVTAESLDDGLHKVASGDLAPEVLGLMLHVGSEKGTAGYLFEIQDGEGSVRPYVKGEFGPEKRIALPAETIREVAKAVENAGAGALPANLYADEYTHFKVNVLRHEKEVIARQFAGMDRARNGERQLRFDELVKTLDRLRKTLF